MNPEVLRRAQAIAAGVLANVSESRLSDPTPCRSWDVGELIEHMIGAQHWSQSAITGSSAATGSEGASQRDFCAEFDSAAAAAAEAFSAEGALEKMVDPGFGEMPGTALLGLSVTDTFTHAWDLAKATGQSTDLDAGVAGALLEAARNSIQDSFRGPEGAPFGPERPAPAGATAADRLAAFLGREV